MKKSTSALLCPILLSMLLLVSACGGDDKPGAPVESTDGTPTTNAVSTPESDAESVTDAQSESEIEDVTETKEETMPETIPDTKPVEDPALNVFPSGGKNIEIGIFWEPPAEFTTPEQYDWIRDANITFIEATNHRGEITHEVAQKQVELAAERGITVSYGPGRDGKTLTGMSDAEITAYVRELAENSAITGLHVVDEPANPWDYGRICAAVSAGGLTPRLNFLPYWATWVFENYRGHVEDTVIATGKESYGYLCYDEYPFKYQAGTTPNMFYNMNLFREIGLKYDVPTGFYVQSIGENGNFRRTNGDEIRYHTSAALAYGLKSLTYFTWWTTGFCDPADYAIISPYGEKTDIYDDVAAVNGQILTTGPLLRRLDALEVYHTAGREDAIEIRKEGELPVYPGGSGLGFIVSLMEDRETGRDYIMLVNKNFKKALNPTVKVGEGITHLYNCTNGTYEEIDISEGSFKLSFAPGGYVLLAVGQQDRIVERRYDRGANLAEGKAASVHAVNPGAGFYAYCVTDGLRDNSDKTAQGYRSAQDTGFVEIDLGRTVAFNRVDIYPTGTNYDRGQMFPQSFTIAVSVDGESWTEVVRKTDYTDACEAIPVFSFDAVEARYVRLNVTAGSKNGGFEIGEMEIYNDDGSLPMPDNGLFYTEIGGEAAGTKVSFEKPVTTSSHVPDWEAYKLVDGNIGSGWTSGLKRHNTENGEEWILVDLMTSYDLDRIVLTPRSGDNYFPKKYRIEVSEDGETFTEVYNGEHPAQRDGQNPIEVKLDSAKGRYVRITGYVLRDASGFNDGFLFSLMELEIYNK